MALEEEIKKMQEIQHKNITEMPVKGFKVTKEGKIKTNSITNIMLILERDPLLAHKIAFNEFTYEIELLDDLESLMIEKGPLEDDIYPALLGYIEQKYDTLFSEKLLNGAITNVARKNVFNPVLDYFEDCLKKWDHKKRAADFLPTFLGAEKNEVTTLETKIFFTGAVTKAYKPASKFDYVLDLVGGQGSGKTTLLKKVSNGWYTDNFNEFDNKDDYQNMLRCLIVNDDEMTATNNSSFEILKKFVSSQVLEFRKAYGRNAIRRYKNFVMARTTNQKFYLKDKTGERRFLPVKVNKDYQKKSPLTELTQEYIDQLWGEFTSYYQEGFNFILTEKQEKMLQDLRDNFTYVDTVEEAVSELLIETDRSFLTSHDIAFKLGESNIINNSKLSRKIKYIMDNNSNWTYTRKRINGHQKRGYQKIL